MNSVKRWIIALAICFVIKIAFFPYTKDQHTPPKPVPMAPVKVQKDGTTTRKKVSSSKGVRAFMAAIGRMESKGNHRAVSDAGFLGKYQFSPNTIRAMGFKVTREEFLESPELQDRVMLAFMRDNRRTLAKVIQEYSGDTVNGVLITPSGVVAAAHLSGVGGVLTFFKPHLYSYRTSDSNGATVAMYMQKFANYDLRGM